MGKKSKSGDHQQQQQHGSGACIATLKTGARCDCASFTHGQFKEDKCTTCAHKLSQHPGASPTKPAAAAAPKTGVENIVEEGLVKSRQQAFAGDAAAAAAAAAPVVVATAKPTPTLVPTPPTVGKPSTTTRKGFASLLSASRSGELEKVVATLPPDEDDQAQKKPATAPAPQQPQQQQQKTQAKLQQDQSPATSLLDILVSDPAARARMVSPREEHVSPRAPVEVCPPPASVAAALQSTVHADHHDTRINFSKLAGGVAELPSSATRPDCVPVLDMERVDHIGTDTTSNDSDDNQPTVLRSDEDRIREVAGNLMKARPTSMPATSATPKPKVDIPERPSSIDTPMLDAFLSLLGFRSHVIPTYRRETVVLGKEGAGQHAAELFVL